MRKKDVKKGGGGKMGNNMVGEGNGVVSVEGWGVLDGENGGLYMGGMECWRGRRGREME